jgi:RNA polymerase sigma factor (sigma-70 family)
VTGGQDAPGFPGLRRWNDTADILQGALIRFLRSLEHVEVGSPLDFLNFAAFHIRRELLDLVRRHRAVRREVLHEDLAERPPEPVVPEDAEELERWSSFHEAVERLPAEEQAVVSLIFYHDWTRQQVAEELGISERTVRRRWESALVHLHAALRWP